MVRQSMTAELTVRSFQSADADSVIDLWQKALPNRQPWNDKQAYLKHLNETHTFHSRMGMMPHPYQEVTV